MSAREGLIVILPEDAGQPPHWLRVIDGAVVQSGEGTNWLAACGLAALPGDAMVMLVTPTALTALHWSSHPDLPVRQARAVTKLAALREASVSADQLFASTDANDDPARPHLVGVTARADLTHWLLWAQHHGLDPDVIVPAAMLLPPPEHGYTRGVIGGETVLRGADMALPGDLALLTGDAPIRDLSDDEVQANAVAALSAPPLDLRQGDFAKRVRRSVDRQVLRRVAIWSGLILFIGLLISLTTIAKQNLTASRLDAESLALARQVLPQATDAQAAEVEMDRMLAARGAGGHAFTAPVAALMSAMQGTPGVSLTALSRDAGGMISATLAAARAEDINAVLLALQAAGYTITATSAQAPSGQLLAQITVRS